MTRQACAALIDSGSPATCINSNALGTMRANGCISGAPVQISSRSRGGFGSANSLVTTETVRLSVQFFRTDTPTASLEFRAFVVPANTMQFPILLGRDSFIRYTKRIYNVLPTRRHGKRVMGEYFLTHNTNLGAQAYVPDFKAPDDRLHLQYAGTSGASLSSTPQLVEVNLVRANGTPALQGNYSSTPYRICHPLLDCSSPTANKRSLWLAAPNWSRETSSDRRRLLCSEYHSMPFINSLMKLINDSKTHQDRLPLRPAPTHATIHLSSRFRTTTPQHNHPRPLPHHQPRHRTHCWNDWTRHDARQFPIAMGTPAATHWGNQVRPTW